MKTGSLRHHTLVLLNADKKFNPLDATQFDACDPPIVASISISCHMQDRGTYMAGQSAALMEAFKLALPSQQALGSMGSGLQRLQAQVRCPVQGQRNTIMILNLHAPLSMLCEW